MRRLTLIIFILSIVISAQSQSDSLMEKTLRMIDKKVPIYLNTTIDGKPIDSNYFKSKITILNFFGFNCGPCHQELSLLNEIKKTMPKEEYQILLIGDGAEKDLRDLRGYHSKRYGKMKRKLGIDSLEFDMIADCPENPVRFLYKSCKGSTEAFKVYAMPTTFFINREGMIKQICIGFAVPRNKEFDEYFYSKLREAEHKKE